MSATQYQILRSIADDVLGPNAFVAFKIKRANLMFVSGRDSLGIRWDLLEVMTPKLNATIELYDIGHVNLCLCFKQRKVVINGLNLSDYGRTVMDDLFKKTANVLTMFDPNLINNLRLVTKTIIDNIEMINCDILCKLNYNNGSVVSIDLYTCGSIESLCSGINDSQYIRTIDIK